MYHYPVMLDECIKGLNINPEGTRMKKGPGCKSLSK